MLLMYFKRLLSPTVYQLHLILINRNTSVIFHGERLYSSVVKEWKTKERSFGAANRRRFEFGHESRSWKRKGGRRLSRARNRISLLPVSFSRARARMCWRAPRSPREKTALGCAVESGGGGGGEAVQSNGKRTMIGVLWLIIARP